MGMHTYLKAHFSAQPVSILVLKAPRVDRLAYPQLDARTALDR